MDRLDLKSLLKKRKSVNPYLEPKNVITWNNIFYQIYINFVIKTPSYINVEKKQESLGWVGMGRIIENLKLETGAVKRC